jgi:hypothetical protein
MTLKMIECKHDAMQPVQKRTAPLSWIRRQPFPRSHWPSRRSALPGCGHLAQRGTTARTEPRPPMAAAAFPNGARRRGRSRALPWRGGLSHGARRRGRSRALPWRRRPFPRGTTARTEPRPPMAAATFLTGHIGRASSFAKATEDKDARPSLFITNH